MKSKISILLILTLSGFLPIACRCGKDVKNFRIVSLGVVTLNLKNLSSDTTRFFPFDSVGKSIGVKDKVDVGMKAPTEFSLSNTAYACSPSEPSSVDRITKLEIIAKTDMQLDSPTDIIRAGDIISNRFIIWDSSSTRTINEFISSRQNLGLYFGPIIRLAKKPFRQTAIKVDINIQLSDNTTHTFKDEVFKIRL